MANYLSQTPDPASGLFPSYNEVLLSRMRSALGSASDCLVHALDQVAVEHCDQIEYTTFHGDLRSAIHCLIEASGLAMMAEQEFPNDDQDEIDTPLYAEKQRSLLVNLTTSIEGGA